MKLPYPSAKWRVRTGFHTRIRVASYRPWYDGQSAVSGPNNLHNGEMTDRETSEISRRCLGVGRRCKLLAEISRMEKEGENAFMNAGIHFWPSSTKWNKLNPSKSCSTRLCQGMLICTPQSGRTTHILSRVVWIAYRKMFIQEGFKIVFATESGRVNGYPHTVLTLTVLQVEAMYKEIGSLRDKLIENVKLQDEIICLRNMCTCFRFTTKKLKIEIADLPSARLSRKKSG
ncbi:plant PDR ABC transporter associated [Artemisia annua]|uniref:Plant PDR ABC transporter associated n=1 Tax=Artemisia annua TaxID=35608 RepID=A0A2U1PZJ7_ARTAN|nr:plant PDR ABC transporter associated [Artemisia annua]